jgi:mono/diheme cytochrome c family protein
MKKFIKQSVLLALISTLALSLNAKEVDKDSGLIVASGMDVVKANCTVCHSAKFITLQRGDRATWLSMIRWMQDSQGLWKFDEKTENTILTYLETNYAPDETARRPNLRKDLLPK